MMDHSPIDTFGHHPGFLNSTGSSLSHLGRVDADTRAWTFSTYCWFHFLNFVL